MKAVLMEGTGGIEVLRLGEHPDPVAGEEELLVRVRAAALNRADLLQRRGRYPPPPGVSGILGLEAAGEVVGAGSACGEFRRGDRVCALLPGGGYAELAAVPAGTAMALPDTLSFEEGAAIPEAFLTAYHNLFTLGGLAPGDVVLVHAGGSGVGTAAVQLVREAGGTAFVTARSPEKIDRCLSLGARAGWHAGMGPFAPWVADQTDGKGADIILDLVGASYFEQNLLSLASGGRLLVVGLMGGSRVERLDLGALLTRRLRIAGSTLRGLPRPLKAGLVRDFSAFALPRFADRRLLPVIDSVYDWADVAAAHARMETNANVGKIVLRVTT